MSEEMICKNCKYHYKEEISFDYPQSCCNKRKAVIEEWFNCNDFEYSDKYIKQLQQENKQLKEVIDKTIEELKKGLNELDTRRRGEVYIEQYIEEALNMLKEVE